MKNKISALAVFLLVLCTVVTGAFPVLAESRANTVGEAQSLADGIVNYKLSQTGSSSVQNWIDTALTKNAGTTAEWYILSLSQSGSYNFSSYESSLKNYLNSNTVYSASSRQKYALTLIAIGSSDNYIAEVLENSIGQQGVASWIYGMHLLNNGYVSRSYTKSAVKQKLLSLQLSDGGWAVTGKSGDVDVTAMAVQALAPYYKTESSVKSAVNKALSLLSSRQLEDGDFSSYGVPNLESTAQVVTALASLGVDGENDNRFIKNGNTLLDGMKKYKLSEGDFCHKINGGSNDTATVQAYYSMIAYIRMAKGKSGLYIFDNRNPDGLVTEKATEVKKNQSTKTEKTDSQSSDKNSEKSSVDDKKTISETVEKSQKNTKATEENFQKKSSRKKKKKPETSETAAEKTTLDIQQNTEETLTTVAEKTDSVKNENNSYKLWISIAIAGLGGIACIVLFLTKKRNRKNFLAVLTIVAIGVCFVVFTDFYTPDSYYNGNSKIKENAVGTVTLSIRCDTVADEDNEHIPADGVVLETKEFDIQEKDTVYNILTEAAREYNIQLENSGSEEMAYIAGINYLYEFDFGDQSGWIYHVNGKSPSVGCAEYKLKDGDEIEWLYTCNLGKDLE